MDTKDRLSIYQKSLGAFKLTRQSFDNLAFSAYIAVKYMTTERKGQNGFQAALEHPGEGSVMVARTTEEAIYFRSGYIYLCVSVTYKLYVFYNQMKGYNSFECSQTDSA